MRNYEKKSFIQIFLGYFISITIFVLLLGFLYFNQQKTFIMQKTAMNMHQYLTTLRQTNFTYEQEGYSYEIDENIKMKRQLPQKINNFYIKSFLKPYIVKIKATIVDEQLKSIKNFTILLQGLLISFFGIVSWILARKSLQPMIDTISHLDRFTKDLIHDLNTPVTSILLNTKMLKKDANEKSLKKINRIENSAKNISSLYANLEVLLDELSLVKENFDMSDIITDTIETYKIIYPHIQFKYDNKSILINSNQNTVKRILDNIISNACKYSIDNEPMIIVTYENNTLTIKDNGKGIKYPKKIFERSYKENESGYGIGMHIVHRLCSELQIKIDIQSEQNVGTIISFKF